MSKQQKEVVLIKDIKNLPTFKALHLTHTLLTDLTTYCQNHPRQYDLLMASKLNQQGVDSTVYRFRKRLEMIKLFQRLSLYGFFYAKVSENGYEYIGKNADNNIWTHNVPRQYNGMYVSVGMSVYFLIEELYDRALKARQKALEVVDVDYEETLASGAPTVQEPTVSIAHEASELPSEFQNMTFGRQMTFSQLPENLKKVVQDTIGKEAS